MMEDDQQFCLRWNNHQSTLISVFDTLLENEKLVDCTLAAEGRIMKAHKVVLSACSPYFATLLQEQYDKHPIFILKDVKYQELRAMMDYMYRGEVNISQDQLAALLKAAESLQIKGLSDNRTGTAPRAEQQQQQQQQQHHRGLNVPGGSKLSGGYTLEAQTKRARVGAGPLDTQDISGSREGSSSPSRRRRKVRRRSVENAMAEPHDNSNSSQQQQSSLLQSNAGLAGVSAITAAASALASQLPTVSGVAATANAIATTQAAIASAQQQPQQQQQQPGQQLTTTTSVTKKTENVKGTSDAINTENVQVAAVAGGTVATGIVDNEAMEHVKTDKQNHKQKQTGGSSGKEGSELVIEPKSEYDEEGNDETCEDLTLDDEDMGMDDLDQNAGTSQGGEGSSQGYAAWQHDRSQDEILLSTQEAQQRDPQDLSITRIAGLTWNEWNARLAMPLVTQLREGVHPLIFPTDLSINQAIEKQNTSSSNAAIPMTTSNTSGTDAADNDDEPKSPPLPVTPPNESSNDAVASGASRSAPISSTPLNCSNSNAAGGSTSSEKRSSGKLKRLTEEEARTLMLKAAAEKTAAAFNNSGNLSDSSYGADVKCSLSNAGGAGDSTSDFHTALSGGGSGGAFADVSGAAGLCNINLLSISAMNSLIGGAAASSAGTGNNGGIGLGGSSAGLSLSGSGGGSGSGGVGSGSGAGHPCPECGRVYKLKSSLRNHQKWECGKEPQFQCPFCVYRAKQKMHIGRHMERMHKEKFIKLEDLKSYTGSGENDENGAVQAAAVAAAAALASADLRQHFASKPESML